MIPAIDSGVLGREVAQTAGRPNEGFRVKHVGIGVAGGLMTVADKYGVMRSHKRTSSRIDW